MQITVEKMVDRIIRKFGFEDEHTINFCRLAEKETNIRILQNIYNKYMNLDIMLDE